MRRRICAGFSLQIFAALLLVACGTHARTAGDPAADDPGGQQVRGDRQPAGAEGGMQPAAGGAAPLVRIKVLASNGDWDTALATARTLSARGYPAYRVDLVEKKFAGTRVYFSEGFEEAARRIAAELGGEEVDVKPLTWRSIYQIIVVTDSIP